MKAWYTLEHPETVSSPALLVVKDRVLHNIHTAIAMVGGPERLRPHVKTVKAAAPVQLMLDAGIRQFKCATIAEAEMLAEAGAPDILLAYQPVGPTLDRWMTLIGKYPGLTFSCLVDHADAVKAMAGRSLRVWIDVNVGQNRTGVVPSGVVDLYHVIASEKSLVFCGLHVYDGHIHAAGFDEREAAVALAFKPIPGLVNELEKQTGAHVDVIAGGSPTFSIHATGYYTCSPGTFIYWDAGYTKFEEQGFLPAVVLLARVISLPTPDRICLDLGHKAVAAENDISHRVKLLSVSDAKVISQSEEHLVLECPAGHRHRIGEVVYGLPVHVCPTVALHAHLNVVENGIVTGQWHNIARARQLMV